MDTLEQRPILLVEDDEIDIKKVQRAIASMVVPVKLHVCQNSDTVLDYLEALDETMSREVLFPKCIILDLNMPRMSGLELLKYLKEDNSLKMLPVVVFSSSDSPREVQKCYHLGVAGFFLKPSDPASFNHVVKLIAGYWTSSL